ncbi:spore coat protein GerQ [Paenibacillus sp. YAF4_2]|uniref:spore coat protein GerQ n=1 Tax=Paenibacillus sp. YAF4_2 TaxID=3233085 RepID=UPI003F97F86E
MSYGYGYKNGVSPASTGGYGGGVSPFAGGGYGGFPSVLPASTNPNMPMQMPMSMPMQMMPMTGTMGAQSLPPVPNGAVITPSGGNIVAVPVAEESYVENILRLNRGKLATFYMTYENNREWNAKVFRGIIEAAGRDHIIISDPSTGMRYLLLSLNLDYVTFDGEINYEYPFQGGLITNTTPLAQG